MGGAGRGATSIDKQLYLYRVITDKGVQMVEIQQLLGISREMLYKVLRNPGRYLTLDKCALIAFRLDEPLNNVIAGCLGGANQVRNEGTAWFGTIEDKEKPPT